MEYVENIVSLKLFETSFVKLFEKHQSQGSDAFCSL